MTRVLAEGLGCWRRYAVLRWIVARANYSKLASRKDFFNYIFERSTQLRHLRVFKGLCSIAGGLAATIKNFPFLEELHIYFGIISEEDIVNIGRSYPLLKSFIMNASGHEKFSLLPSPADDYHALARAIARSMPELRHLALLENSLTDVGFQAILDGCPHLELLLAPL